MKLIIETENFETLESTTKTYECETMIEFLSAATVKKILSNYPDLLPVSCKGHFIYVDDFTVNNPKHFAENLFPIDNGVVRSYMSTK